MVSKAYLIHAIFMLLLILVPLITSQSKSIESSFGFLKSLEGSMKGQRVDGLHQLKRYLAKFGYLENTTMVDDESDELFDENLEAAIKTYQLNYKLSVTGRLDATTVELMMKPRCGCPDIINGRNTMIQKKDKTKSYEIRKFMNGTSLYAFSGTKWPPSQYNLTYQILANTLVLGAKKMGVAVSEALSTWGQHSPFTFQGIAQGNQSNLIFGFTHGDRGDGTPFDGPQGFLAFSNFPTDGHSNYDASENWSDNPRLDQFDLHSVVLHEVGHLLGLAHTPDPSAVMFAIISPGEKKRDLQLDDIQGIEALYSQRK